MNLPPAAAYLILAQAYIHALRLRPEIVCMIIEIKEKECSKLESLRTCKGNLYSVSIRYFKKNGDSHCGPWALIIEFFFSPFKTQGTAVVQRQLQLDQNGIEFKVRLHTLGQK